MRRDAKERRDRIIAVATRMFQQRGYDVALEEIADQAGVGRGTLYRNFSDRRALAIAVINGQVEKLETLSLGLRDDARALFPLMRMMADVMGVNLRLARAVRAEAATDPFLEMAARRDKAIEEPLARAKAAGLVRRDFDTGDVLRAAAMIAAPAEAAPEAHRIAMMDAAIDLLLDGMRPR